MENIENENVNVNENENIENDNVDYQAELASLKEERDSLLKENEALTSKINESKELSLKSTISKLSKENQDVISKHFEENNITSLEEKRKYVEFVKKLSPNKPNTNPSEQSKIVETPKENVKTLQEETDKKWWNMFK